MQDPGPKVNGRDGTHVEGRKFLIIMYPIPFSPWGKQVPVIPKEGDTTSASTCVIKATVLTKFPHYVISDVIHVYIRGAVKVKKKHFSGMFRGVHFPVHCGTYDVRQVLSDLLKTKIN